MTEGKLNKANMARGGADELPVEIRDGARLIAGKLAPLLKALEAY